VTERDPKTNYRQMQQKKLTKADPKQTKHTDLKESGKNFPPDAVSIDAD
jgi:hypothetical protein